MKSPGSDKNLDQEFEDILMRLDWSPTGGRWWVSFAGGLAPMEGGGISGTSGYPHIQQGAGVGLAVGLGADLGLTQSFVLRVRAEHLIARPWIPESGGFEVEGWTLGSALVWFP